MDREEAVKILTGEALPLVFSDLLNHMTYQKWERIREAIDIVIRSSKDSCEKERVAKSFEELKEKILKSEYKSEYKQVAIVMLRNIFEALPQSHSKCFTDKEPSAEMMTEQTRATLKDTELLSDNEVFGSQSKECPTEPEIREHFGKEIENLLCRKSYGEKFMNGKVEGKQE